jgi:hypothetical protein
VLTELAYKQLGQLRRFRHRPGSYENFCANRGHSSGNPYADLINAMPKCVASRSLTETRWNATVLGPDAAGAIVQLKNEPGKDLIKYVTNFDDTLVRARLIDEFRFWIRPVSLAPDNGCSKGWTSRRSSSSSSTRKDFTTDQ